MAKKPVKKPAKKPPKEKAKEGRKSLYQPHIAEEAYRLCLLGARDIDLAGCFGVSVTTISNWKLAHVEFLEAITRGKHQADGFIACALYERAKGAEWQEEVAVKYKVSRDKEAVKVITVTRRVPPDTPACIFWLKNRQRKAWRDKVDYSQLNEKRANEPQRVTFKMDRDIEKEEKDA